MKHLVTLFTFAALMWTFAADLSAQALTNVRLTSGMTAVRHPISAGNLTFRQGDEKAIAFSVSNLSNLSITRSFKLYMLPLPSGTPIVLWQKVQTFAPFQNVAYDRNTDFELGSIVTQNVGQYRLELRGADGADLNLVRTVSPLVPHINGTNPATVNVISPNPVLSLVLETAGTGAVRFPTSIGNLTLQYQKEKNINFSVRNISSQPVTRAFRLYMVPVIPGPSEVLWEGVLSFTVGQTLTFNRTNAPGLGSIVTQAPGLYRLELRGSNIPDVTTVIPTAPLVPVSGAQNPVTVNVVECPDDYLAINPLGPVTLCFGQTQTLTAGFSPNFTYQWRNGSLNIAGATSNVYTATASGSYSVVISKVGCPTYTSPPVSVTIQAQITPSIAGLAAQYSNQDAPVTLTGSPAGGTFTGPGMSGNSFDPAAAGVGTHTITYAGNVNGCAYTISQTVTVIDCPGQIVIAPGGPVNLCPGDEITLSVPADPSYSYQWRNDGTNLAGQTNTSLTVNSSGKFEVLITKPGCTPYVTPQVIVTVQPVINPSITGIGNTVSNNAPPINLIGTPAGGTFSGPGMSGNTFTASVAGIGTHTIVYAGTLNGCPYSASIQVTVRECPGTEVIAPAGPHNLCFGQTIRLAVPGNALFTYQWRRSGTPIPFANTAAYIANQSGTYDVVISRSGCPAFTTQSVSVTIQAQIIASINGLLAQYSNQAPPVTMTGNPAGGTFSGPGVTGNVFSPSVAGVGTHTITYTGNVNGCPYLANFRVTVVSCPANVLITSGGSLNICTGGSVVLSAPNDPNATFQWQRNGTNISGAVNRTFTAFTAGEYTVILTRTGCPPVTSNVLSVTVQPPISASITGAGRTLELTDPPVTLTGNPAGGTFTGPGMVGNTFNPTLSGPGRFRITYSGTLNGCPYSTFDSMFVNPPNPCDRLVYDKGSRTLNGDFYALIDFDSDGLMDVVTATAQPGRITYFRNNGFDFDLGVSFPTPDHPYLRFPYVGAAESENLHYHDFDNDGAKDLLISFLRDDNCAVVSRVRIYWGRSTPPYFSGFIFTELPLGGLQCPIAYGTDFDNNGRRDIFVESLGSPGQIMFRNNGARNFAPVAPTALTSRGSFHVCKDWNGDNREDLLTVDLNIGDMVMGLAYYQGLGTGNYAPPRFYYQTEQPIFPHLTLQANPLTDNRLDFVFNAQTDGTNGRRLYTGSWDVNANDFRFRTQNTLRDFAQLLNIVDINKDGFDDVISQVFENGGQIRLMASLNNGNGDFSNMITVATSRQFSFRGVFDFGDECLKAVANSTDSLGIYNVDVVNRPPFQIRKGGITEPIVEAKAFEMSLYPNPTSGLLNLDLTAPQAGNASVVITDLTGRTVSSSGYTLTEGTQTLNLDLTGQPSGIYLLTLKTDTETRTVKVVLE